MTVTAIKELQNAPQMGRREAAAQDKLKRILQAATVLFAEKGFHGTTIPDVANAAGVGAGTIYRYFENKEDLVNGVFISSKTKLKEYLEVDLAEATDASLKARFGFLWDNLCLFVHDNPREFYFLEMQEHSKYLSAKSKKLEREVLAPLRLFALQGKKDGVIKQIPSMTLIALVWGAFVGLFKANALGYAQLSPAIMEDSKDICWKMISL